MKRILSFLGLLLATTASAQVPYVPQGSASQGVLQRGPWAFDVGFAPAVGDTAALSLTVRNRHTIVQTGTQQWYMRDSTNRRWVAVASVDTTKFATTSQLQAGLAGKANTNHTQAISTITGLPENLALKDSRLNSLENAVGGVIDSINALENRPVTGIPGFIDTLNAQSGRTITTTLSVSSDNYVWSKLSDSVVATARDGVKCLRFGRRIYQYGGYTPTLVNEIWSQDIDSLGSPWRFEGNAPFSPRHCFGVAKNDSTGYGYVAFGDGATDVWRTLDGVTFELIHNSPEAGPGTANAMFGFTSHTDPATGAWAMYRIGGIVDNDNVITDVWRSFDGISWQRIATNLPQFGVTMSGQVASYNGRIWAYSGFHVQTSSSFVLGKRFFNKWYSSADGITWRYEFNHPGPPVGWGDMAVHEGRLVMVAGVTVFGDSLNYSANTNTTYMVNGEGICFRMADRTLFPRHASSILSTEKGLLIFTGNMYADAWLLKHGREAANDEQFVQLNPNQFDYPEGQRGDVSITGSVKAMNGGVFGVSVTAPRYVATGDGTGEAIIRANSGNPSLSVVSGSLDNPNSFGVLQALSDGRVNDVYQGQYNIFSENVYAMRLFPNRFNYLRPLQVAPDANRIAFTGIDAWPLAGSNTSASFGDVVQEGEATMLHFGYKEGGNSNYRKTGLFFIRQDAATRGRIGFYSNAGFNNSSATIADSVFSIGPAGDGVMKGPLTLGGVMKAPDAEVTTPGNGITVPTPDGTKRYRIAVDNNGAITTTLVP